MLPKYIHEIRDPIHVFIHLDSDERDVVDSPQFQRLRHIHQLAMSYLVYPGATHKRFEHALGTMELATKVFDTVTSTDNIDDRVSALIPLLDPRHRSDMQGELAIWRQTLRMAALFHDIGHLPFSHAAEELLPNEPYQWDHERITVEIIKSKEMREIWDAMPLRPQAEEIAKIAVGRKKLPDENYTLWEEVLSEIIVGDALGVDRMDYLLRDSHHAGVAYGKFDHHRLLDTMRILPTTNDSDELALGVEQGGIHSVEALVLARYFMYTQVYFHPVRRIYDKHLIDFLREWLQEGKFPTSPGEILQHNDVRVMNAMLEATTRNDKAGEYARRILQRGHFKLIRSKNTEDSDDAMEFVHIGLVKHICKENVFHDISKIGSGDLHFPVIRRDREIVSSTVLSNVLQHIPDEEEVDNIYVHPDHFSKAQNWLNNNKIDSPRQHPDEEVK